MPLKPFYAVKNLHALYLHVQSTASLGNDGQSVRAPQAVLSVLSQLLACVICLSGALREGSNTGFHRSKPGFTSACLLLLLGFGLNTQPLCMSTSVCAILVPLLWSFVLMHLKLQVVPRTVNLLWDHNFRYSATVNSLSKSTFLNHHRLTLPRPLSSPLHGLARTSHAAGETHYC